MKYCFEHKHEVRKGKRACEYRLIWERDVTGLSKCDMADAVIVRADEPLYREATRDEIAIDDLGVVSAVDVYTMDVVQVNPKEEQR